MAVERVMGKFSRCGRQTDSSDTHEEQGDEDGDQGDANVRTVKPISFAPL